MAHITYAKISGLAGRQKDLEITFNRHINVLFGINGVGKTTLLKILHSAMFFDADLIDGLPFTSAEIGLHSVSAGRDIIREIRNEPDFDSADLFSDTARISKEHYALILKTHARRAKTSWKVKNKKNDTLDRIKLSHEYLPTTRPISMAEFPSARRTVSGDAVSEEANINNMMEAKLQQQWVKYFSPLQAKIQDVQQRGIARILSTVLSPDTASSGDADLEPEVAYALARRFLASHSSSQMPRTKATFVARYQKDKSLAAVVNEIASIEKEANSLLRPKDHLQSLLNKLFLNKRVDLSGGAIKVLFRKPDDEPSPLRLSQLSSGEKQALYILIHALRANVNSLMIDEPELSLHIDWQRQLIDAILMLNQNTQIIMATHSPEIMATISDKCIFEI